MSVKNSHNYKDSIGKLFLDEETRFPIGVLDDFVIDYKNLKIEGFLIKDSFFKGSKVIRSSSVHRWSEDLFVSKDFIKTLSFYSKITEILIEGNYIIWKKVFNENGECLGRVSNLFFSPSSFFGLSIVLRKSFFGLFFYGDDRIISKKNILDISSNGIIIKDKSIARA